MSHTPRSAFLRKDDLWLNLGGSFTARARGLLATEFALLDPAGEEFGRLSLGGVSGAELRLGDRAVTFESSGKRYQMISDSGEVLVSGRRERSIDSLELSCDGWTYEVRVSFLRNLAITSHPGGEEAVRLSGSLAGRSYRASFDTGDGCALPVALFVLWHVATNRRRAYQAGGRT